LKGPIDKFSSPAFLEELCRTSPNEYALILFFNASYSKNHTTLIPTCRERKQIDYILTLLVVNTQKSEVVYVDRRFGAACLNELNAINHEIFTIAKPFYYK